MKIHESMNVSLHKKLLFPFLATLLWLFAGSVSGQAPGLDVYNLTILKDDTFHFDTIRHYSVGVHPEIKRLPGHGVAYFNPRPYDGNPAGEPNYPHLGFKAPGGYNNPSINYMHYIPAPGFIGRDTIEVFYHRKFGNSGATLPAYKIYNILVVPSFLFAENDYASTTVGQAVEIEVLANDFGNGTNLTIAEITNVNSGTAVRTAGNTKVLFTPQAGFTGVGHLNYTICDAEGSCDMATVSICVNPVTIPAYDTIFVTTKKNTPQVIILALDSNYVLATPPAHGDLDSMETLVYVPDHNYVGYDTFVFFNPIANLTRVVQIRVLNASGDYENVFLFDDVVFTPVDETVEEIHLLDNDNGAQWLMNVGVLGYPNTAEGGHLTYLYNVGKGVYMYEPPAGFEGIDKFTYRATPPYGNSGSYEYATCYIVVSNLNPSEPVFHITTPENTPLVLGDHLPFVNYEYENYSNGDAGTVEFHPGFATVTSPYGQTFSGNNMLIYTPDEDFTGEDEFEFNYCPGGQNNNCPLVKVEVEVVEVSNPQADTLCAGSDCVWSGDTNRDGLVDVRDILPIGLCMGEAGEDRTNGSVAWYGQYADNWNSFSACLDYDAKHVDSDGNGIVASQDTSAISQFYGMYHNLTPEPASAISELPFYIEEPDYSNIEPGDVLYAPIHLGNDSIAAIDAYGLTFQLEYDPAIFESVNVNFYNTSWMSYNSPLLSMAKKPFLGRIDAGYTRTSGHAASGYGVIGVVEFIVIDDLAGGRLNKNSTTVNLRSLGMMNGNGETFGLNGNSITFHLNLNGEPAAQDVTEAQLNVFPNPAGEFVNIHLNGYGNEIGRVQLYNLVGEVVYDSGSLQAKRVQVKVGDLAQGVYVMKVHANDGSVLQSKVEVIK